MTNKKTLEFSLEVDSSMNWNQMMVLVKIIHEFVLDMQETKLVKDVVLTIKDHD